jgi:hypothetical protein
LTFLIQGCRRRRLPSIGISPGLRPDVPPGNLRVIPDSAALSRLAGSRAAAAVANAVFNATGVRVRDYLIRLDKVLPGLPSADT